MTAIEHRTIHRAPRSISFVVVRLRWRQHWVARRMHAAGHPLPLIRRVCGIPAERLPIILGGWAR